MEEHKGSNDYIDLSPQDTRNYLLIPNQKSSGDGDKLAEPYLDTVLTNKGQILKFMAEYKLNVASGVISVNPSSQIDFIHILAICQFMLIPEKYKTYLDKNPDSINIDKEFLFEILTNYQEGETYFYRICYFHVDLNIDIFNDFLTIILLYLNTLIITSSIDIPLDAINWDAINWDAIRQKYDATSSAASSATSSATSSAARPKAIGSIPGQFRSSYLQYNEDLKLKETNADALAQNPDAFKADLIAKNNVNFLKVYDKVDFYKTAPEEQGQASSRPNQKQPPSSRPTQKQTPIQRAMALIILDIKHYQEFLNQQILSNLPNLYVSGDRDFLTKFVNEFKISPETSFKSIDPPPPPRDPHGPPRGPHPIPPRGPPFNLDYLDYLRDQENYKCKYAFTHYIDKLIQKRNYPGVYLLLLLYIQMFSDSKNPEDILQEIPVNILLFYTTYKTLLEVAPISMDNLSNYLAITGYADKLQSEADRLRQKADSDKLTRLYSINNLLYYVIFEKLTQADVDRQLIEITEDNEPRESQEALEDEAKRQDNANILHALEINKAYGSEPPTSGESDFDDFDKNTIDLWKKKHKILAEDEAKRNTRKKAKDGPAKKAYNEAEKKTVEAAAAIGEAEGKRKRREEEEDQGNNADESYNMDSDPDLGGGGPNNNKGGQVGGNCEFDTQQLNQMHVIKMLIEASHDLKGERSDKSVYNSQTISAAKINNNGTAVNLYDKMYGVLTSFVTNLPLKDPSVHPHNYEDHFLDDLKQKIVNGTKVDENKYLHSIVEILTVDCREVVDNFFFYNSIHFSLRDMANNTVSYQMLKQKIITTYPSPDWWLVADIYTYSKAGFKYSDLYLYVIKKEDRLPLINTTFKLYEQDMGLGYISDIAFRESDYYNEYTRLFNGQPENNIDVFFETGAPNPLVEFKLVDAYTSATMAAKEKNKTGEIKVVNGEIDITSVWAIDIAKQFDPLSVENPPYSQIFNEPIEQGLNIETIKGFNKMYIGYPTSLPIDRAGNVGPGPTSSDFFDQQVEALGSTGVVVNPIIKKFLKDLNGEAFKATLFAFDTLLNFWINFPEEDGGVEKLGIVDNYNLILENGNIIGFNFTSTVVSTFTFTAHIADCTVTNICYAMIKCANEWTAIQNSISNPSAAFHPENTPENRIIQQMINIMNHPNYKYPGEKNLEYALTIIATIKSFGDESQLLSKTRLQTFLDLCPELNKSSKNLFLKTSDRPLVGHLLLYLQSFIAELLVPHRSFGQQEEITDKIPTVFNPKTSKDVTIYNVNASIISNAANIITVVKSTYELLLEIPDEYEAAYHLLQAKFPDLGSSFGKEIQTYVDELQKVAAEARAADERAAVATEARAADERAAASVNAAGVFSTKTADDIAADERAVKARAEAAEAAEAAAVAAEAAEAAVAAEAVTNLKIYREYIAEIKQLLLSLEYYNDKHIPDAEKVEDNKQLLKTITEEYLDLQIKTAVSKSIPSIILTDITVFNNKHGINKIKDITDALSNMYNNLDFYSRIFDLHDIACELFIEKLQMYIVIINNSSLPGETKQLVTDHYNFLIGKVTGINNKFVEDAKTKLEKNIETRELKSARGRSSKNTGSTAPSEEGTSAEELQKKVTEKGTQQSDAQGKAAQLKSNILTAKNDWNMAELQLVTAKAELLAAEAKVDAAKKEVDAAKKEVKSVKKDSSKLVAADQKLDAANQKLAAAELNKNAANQKKKADDADEKAKKAALKVLEKEETGNNSVIADIIKSANSLAKKLNVAVLSAASSSHDVASDVAKSIRNLFGTGHRFVSKGGKRSIQNNQKYQKKYTKRIRKNIYRKKTLKRFKIKRPKRTKKHRGK